MKHASMPDHLLARSSRATRPNTDKPGGMRDLQKTPAPRHERYRFRQVLDRAVADSPPEHDQSRSTATKSSERQALKQPRQNAPNAKQAKTQGFAAELKDATRRDAAQKPARDATDQVKQQERGATGHSHEATETRAPATTTNEVDRQDEESSSEHEETATPEENKESSREQERQSPSTDEKRPQTLEEAQLIALAVVPDETVRNEIAKAIPATDGTQNSPSLVNEASSVAAAQSGPSLKGKNTRTSTTNESSAKASSTSSAQIDPEQNAQAAAGSQDDEEGEASDETETNSTSTRENAGAKSTTNELKTTTTAKSFGVALQEVHKNGRAARGGRATASQGPDAETQQQMNRLRRQQAATKVVNRMTLMHGARADVDLPELGRITIQARMVGGEVDVNLTTQDAAALSILQSTSAAMESDLRKSLIDLRNLDIHQEAEASDAERERDRARAGDAEEGTEHQDEGSRSDEMKSEGARKTNQVRIVL